MALCKGKSCLTNLIELFYCDLTANAGGIVSKFMDDMKVAGIVNSEAGCQSL